MSSEVRPLESLCSLVVDCPHSTPAWTESGHIVLRNQNIRNGRLDLSAPSFTDSEHFAQRNRRATPTSGDIVITREAPMGEVCMIPEGLECCLGQRQVLLRPNPRLVNPKFLLFALQSPSVQHQISWNEGTGSTVSNLRIPVLKSLSIPTPERALQDDVAATLGAIDGRIDNLRKTNATLETIVQALFKSWFVDFDPVRAKAEGREPEGMDAATAALFPSEFEHSGLGLIPKGWKEGQFGDVLVEDRERVRQQDASVMSAVRTGHLVPSDEHFSKRVHSANTSNYKLVQPLAFAYNPSRINIGSIGLNESGGLVAVSPIYVVARPINVEYSFLIWHHLRTEVIREQIAGLCSGSVRQGLAAADFFSLPLVRPSEAVLRQFLATRKAIYGRIHAIEAHNSVLEELRDTLLPRLISGKLRLPEAEATIEETLA